MARSLAAMAAVVLVALGLSACGGGVEKGSRSAQPATTTAEQAATNGETSEAAAGDVAGGKKVFADAGCAGCHSTGTDRTVGPGLAGATTNPTLANGEPMTDESLSAWIKGGGTGTIGTMPPQPTLTDPQLADLVAYMRTLK